MRGSLPDRVEVVNGDITTLQVDAIVNAANQTLLGGGGVDGAIHWAAGPGLREECRQLDGCRTGEAKITRGYNLPARFVIHTVGPVWKGGMQGEDDLLAACYRNSLALAELSGIQSIAFPSISTGAYRFPPERAARIAVRTVREFLAVHPSVRNVILVCHGDEAFRIYSHILENERQDNPDTLGEELLLRHLLMIESAHNISIRNQEEVIRSIGPFIWNEIQALSAGMQINTWIAVSGKTGKITLPTELLDRIGGSLAAKQ